MKTFICTVVIGIATLAWWAATSSAQPNTVRSSSGKLQPAPGYSWVSSDPKDLRVKWTSGKTHSDKHPNVVAGAREGKWFPAPGYKWLNDTEGDFRVKWVPGMVHSDRYPNTVAAPTEGKWRPAAGYKWLTNTAGDYRTVAVATASRSGSGAGSSGSGGFGGMRREERLCPECSGAGYFRNDEGYVDFDGRYRTRTVRVACGTCGGQGRVR